jgi:BirA family biotin operon repressor/biotin-[acetyl-CoA-carboxylase] ligase
MPSCGERLAAALVREYFLPATVKFPNDVLLEGRKLCGILAEASTQAGSPIPDYVVLGVGTNLTNKIPPELQGQAVSLAEVLPEPPSPEELLLLWLQEIQKLVFPETTVHPPGGRP